MTETPHRPGRARAFVVVAAVGFLYYGARERVLARRGVQLDHLITGRQPS